MFRVKNYFSRHSLTDDYLKCYGTRSEELFNCVIVSPVEAGLGGESMAHRAYIGQIKPGKVAEYIKAHEEVWPELIEVMRKCGINRESCFVFGNHIFVYVEADDIDATMDKLNREPLNQKWDVYMEPLLEKPNQDSNEFFPPMQEVFCM